MIKKVTESNGLSKVALGTKDVLVGPTEAKLPNLTSHRSGGVLLAVGDAPTAPRLVRKAARLAQASNLPWFVVSITVRPFANRRGHLNRTLKLAQELGAEVIVLPDLNVARGISRVARQRGISVILLGLPRKRGLFSAMRSALLLYRLERTGVAADVQFIRLSADGPRGTRPLWKYRFWFPLTSVRGILIGGAAVCSLTGLNWFVVPLIGTYSVLLVYFLAILILSLFLSRSAVIVAAFLSAFFWNYLFLTPLFTLHIDRVDDAIMFVMFLTFAVIAGNLTARLRLHAEASNVREERISFLHNFAFRMSQAVGMSEIIDITVKDLQSVTGGETAVYSDDSSGNLTQSVPQGQPISLSREETLAAKTARDANHPTGKSTEVYSSLDTLFLPLRTKGRNSAVVAIRFPPGQPLDFEKKTLLFAIVNQAAIILDREYLMELTQEARTNQEIDRLYNALLNLLTHELRTPIAVIQGAVSSLERDMLRERPEERGQLIREAGSALQRLNRLIDNLLDMSRIESGKLKLNLDWCDPREILAGAARTLSVEFPDRKQISITGESNVLLKLDFNLMEKAFYNLLRNAYVHNEGNEIDVAARIQMEEMTLVIHIDDNGRGLAAEVEKNLFVKFSRGSDSVPGIGIGLSIVKGIVESHGGDIRYTNRRPGAAFSIRFPLTPENTRPFQIPL